MPIRTDTIRNAICATCETDVGLFDPNPIEDKQTGRLTWNCQACSNHLFKIASDTRAHKSPVIVDIDGTVCDIEGRNPYEENPRCLFWDRPNGHVRTLVTALSATGKSIVYVSARKESTREATVAWLIANGFGLDGNIRLLMRADNDTRKDHYVKREILAWLRAGGIEPQFAIDDRPSVIREVWLAAGIPVVQVGRSVGVMSEAGEF